MSKEKILFLIYHVLSELPSCIENVIGDSADDPQCSAVYNVNLIKVCIELLKQLDEDCPYNDIESFFFHSGFTKKEYEIFESKRKIESEYYIGSQY